MLALTPRFHLHNYSRIRVHTALTSDAQVAVANAVTIPLMLKPEKVAAEIKAFSDEVIVENGPRYLDVGEWHHLWVDIWVSMFSMSYTLGHLTAYVIPILLLWWWLRSSHVRRRRGRRRLRWIRDLQRAVSGPVTHAVMEVRRT